MTGALAFILILSGGASAGTARAYRLELEPVDRAEASLREALSANAFAGPAAQAAALRQVSAASPGTPASGLAQLAAGLLLLDAGKATDALTGLRHADIARTALPDHALFALARAQEAAGDAAAAAASFLAAAEARPAGPVTCGALTRAGEASVKAGLFDRAVEALGRAVDACPELRARTLLELAAAQEARKDAHAAALAYDRLDDELPASAEAREAQRKLPVLSGLLPPAAPEARAARELRRAQALFDAGRWSDAIAAYRIVAKRKPVGEEAAQVRVRLGHAMTKTGRVREAELELAAVPPESAHAAEAAFLLARCQARRTGKLDAFEAVATRFPGTPWGEEALLTLANDYQKDARSDEALPYFRRLLEGYPEGRYADRASWRVAWADYRAGRFEPAALVLERAARTRSTSFATAGFLYWAGRAHRALGQADRARQLLGEAVRRFEHTYYGVRSREALEALPTAAATPPVPALRGGDEGSIGEIPEPQLTRARQLLLIDRLDEARDELATAPQVPRTLATLAWIDWRRGRLRPAITAMRKAYPGWAGEAGSALPDEVWRILYPLEYADLIRQKAGALSLDPALVAALICQESTFDAGAVSVAGARGLMQILPTTGRTLARSLRLAYRTQALHEPATSLQMGTRYLRDLADRFGGKIERALAAYNAGPHRVDAWTRDRPEMTAEEFIESIPFTETRFYVMAILGSREQYRRIYSFPTPGAEAAAGSPPGPAHAPGGRQ